MLQYKSFRSVSNTTKLEMKLLAMQISRDVALEIKFPGLGISLVVEDAFRVHEHKVIDQSSHLAELWWDIRRRRIKSSVFGSARLDILLQNIDGFILDIIVDALLHIGITVTK
jgi:hypothetical protein